MDGRANSNLIFNKYSQEVIEAIAETAFKTSDYPVTLSFENHCNPKQQARMAQLLRDKFGPMLLTEALSTHPVRGSVDKFLKKGFKL